ncbi:pyridoxamine 5'-phosphate oxidase family protein [Bdellovibrio sp. SKB1291214]|uniref:pyridoxamine 5'-phosphate oxidase family protein n=1 Tax=Bdellovibrio sp. SKB1291214 TaxID=1732569 RepID=UPI000B516AAA|nr:pyridoxamine 5'-phosphate oxidase family protein [Bdellovibrio sp. SKB1291214]UYL10297.1 pyridoxamine 5'-phosphate oxidase family protein [Bdellovibrio sp. SKB1291214]
MEDNTQSASPEIKKLGELIKDIKTAMLVTVSGGNSLHSAPMMTQEVDFDGSLWFIIARNSQKASEIQNENRVNITYSGNNKFVSVTGLAELVDNNPEKVRELWSKAYEAWFPQGPNDPNVQLLKIDVEQAEYWESHSNPVSKILQFVKMATGSHHIKMGNHGELNLRH